MQKPSLTNIKKWLHRPLPFYESYKQKIAIPILLSLLVMIGIIILNPYENMGMFLKQILNVFKYGFIIIFISLIYSLVLPEVFPKIYNSEKWNIQKTLVLFLVTVLTIAINITVFAYFFDNPNNIHFFLFSLKLSSDQLHLAFFR